MVRSLLPIMFFFHLCFFYEKFNESAFLLRERVSHLWECEELYDAESNWGETSKELGINYCFVLFELQHFNVDILLPDVMHDLLEGTLQYETKLILQHVIWQKFISFALFMKTLDGLELGYMTTSPVKWHWRVLTQVTDLFDRRVCLSF